MTDNRMQPALASIVWLDIRLNLVTMRGLVYIIVPCSIEDGPLRVDKEEAVAVAQEQI